MSAMPVIPGEVLEQLDGVLDARQRGEFVRPRWRLNLLPRSDKLYKLLRCQWHDEPPLVERSRDLSLDPPRRGGGSVRPWTKNDLLSRGKAID